MDTEQPGRGWALLPVHKVDVTPGCVLLLFPTPPPSVERTLIWLLSQVLMGTRSSHIPRCSGNRSEGVRVHTQLAGSIGE